MHRNVIIYDNELAGSIKRFAGFNIMGYGNIVTPSDLRIRSIRFLSYLILLCTEVVVLCSDVSRLSNKIKQSVRSIQIS